ncbi:spermidine synthase [Pseudarthrobacter sp. J1738]|uniref:spermidine synthase n=1 Tax=unclassified Pseudarthrobacter TaxID=2647000 RepID=UPI003D2C0A01
MTARRFLRGIGLHASIEEDGFTPGAYVMSIGDAEQSHVNMGHPEEIFYEYLRRMGNVVDLLAPAGQPIRALHLGAGALTLARYIQATRPGSIQVAVELERELLDFVLDALPLPAGTKLTTRVGDARAELAELAAAENAELFDCIVLDIFSGPEAPEHIACTEFYQEAAAMLAPGGVLLVNVGDEPGLTLVRSQVAAMRRAITDVAATAESGMFAGRYPGNIILLGTTTAFPPEWSPALVAAGPHPARVLTGVDLDPISD